MNSEQKAGGNNREHIPKQAAIFFLVFTFLLFANTINQFFLMDDFDVLYSVKYNSLPQVLMGYGTLLVGRFFRPVPMFFFWMQYRLFGAEPLVYHVITLLLHAGNAILGANLFYLLFKNLRAAVICGLVFIAFPNHAEVVHSIAINVTSWATLFCLATLNLFICYRRSGRFYLFGLSALTFLLALLSKEEAIILPFCVLLVDGLLARFQGVETSVLRRARDHGVYFGVLLIVLVSTRHFFGAGAGYVTAEGENIVSIYMNDLQLLFQDIVYMYLKSWRYLFAPISPQLRFSAALAAVLATTFVVISLLLALRSRRDRYALIFCVGFVMITLLPIMGTYRLGLLRHWVRFLYLPSLASCYIISMVFNSVLGGVKKPVLQKVLFVVLMIPIILLTKVYDHWWIQAHRDNRRFIAALVEKCSSFPRYTRAYVSRVPGFRDGIPRVDYALTSAMAVYLDRRYYEVAPVFLTAMRILSLELEEYHTREWNYVWLDWNEQAGLLTEAGQIQPPSSGMSRAWNFKDLPSRRQLGIGSHLEPITVSPHHFPLFRVTGPWAMLNLPPLPPGPPIQCVTIEMMVSSTGNKDVSRIFWISNDDSTYSGGKSIGFFIESDGKFHTYKIPLYRNGLSLIHPEIRQFGIRPSQKLGAIFSIRKVTVEYY
ncbi:MAG: hypothetical protein Kow0099_16790 [Candidatus Abyssubacteria bacterium]